MYNWSVDIKKLKKYPKKFKIWKLEQLINFGLNNKKLNAKVVKENWNKLKIDPKRKAVLKFWLW